MDQKSPPTNAVGLRDDNTGRAIPMPAPAQPDLSTLRRVREEMVARYHAAQRGEMSAEELKVSIYVLSQIAKLIEIDRLEERMDALEKTVTAGERTH
jgi:hypothetical protein